MTSYYLRKFVEDSQNQLAEFLPELPTPITLDVLLGQIAGSEKRVNERMAIIESLVALHKKVVQSPATSLEQKLDLEKRIWVSLGVPVPEKTEPEDPKQEFSQVKDCLIQINKSRHQAVFYLGDKITTKYLLESRPRHLYWERYRIAPKARVNFDGDLEEYLKPGQAEEVAEWIAKFSERCGNILSKLEENKDEALLDNFE